jgi:hypothetical protein
VASAHGRSTLGSGNGEVLGWRGFSEAILALAVPAWHHTVHRTVINRLDGKLWPPKYAKTSYLKKDGPYRPNRTVPSDRTCTTLIVLHAPRYFAHKLHFPCSALTSRRPLFLGLKVPVMGNKPNQARHGAHSLRCARVRVCMCVCLSAHNLILGHRPPSVVFDVIHNNHCIKEWERLCEMCKFHANFHRTAPI